MIWPESAALLCRSFVPDHSTAQWEAAALILALVMAQHSSLLEPSPVFILQNLQNGHAEVMELSRPFQAGISEKTHVLPRTVVQIVFTVML